MPADDDPWTKYFVRFKQNVDDHIANALQGAFGLPSVVSRTMNSQWPDPPRPASDDSNSNTTTTTTTTTTYTSDPAKGRATESSSGQHSPPTSSSFSSHTSHHPQPPPHEIFSSLSPIRSLLAAEHFTDSLYQTLWISFLIESPYSPLRLRHLAQPTPADLPAGTDPSLFGFEDAFEDLLSVTSNQGLPDIHARTRTKREWRDSYPSGLPPILWLHQLCRQGLWDGWEGARPEALEGPVSERWRRWLEEQEGRPFKEQNSSSESTPDETSVAARQTDDSLAKVPSRRVEQTETEEDVYRALAKISPPRNLSEHMDEIFKAFAQGGGTLRDREGFDDSDEGITRSIGDKTAATTTSTRDLPPGWKVDEEVRERKDANGNVTVTRTRTTFDDKAQEVGRETETRSQWSWSSSSTSAMGAADGGVNEEDSGAPKHDLGTEKKGWFWK